MINTKFLYFSKLILPISPSKPLFSFKSCKTSVQASNSPYCIESLQFTINYWIYQDMSFNKYKWNHKRSSADVQQLECGYFHLSVLFPLSPKSVWEKGEECVADVKKGTGQDQVPLSGGAAETKNCPLCDFPFLLCELPICHAKKLSTASSCDIILSSQLNHFWWRKNVFKIFSFTCALFRESLYHNHPDDEMKDIDFLYKFETLGNNAVHIGES